MSESLRDRVVPSLIWNVNTERAAIQTIDDPCSQGEYGRNIALTLIGTLCSMFALKWTFQNVKVLGLKEAAKPKAIYLLLFLPPPHGQL